MLEKTPTLVRIVVTLPLLLNDILLCLGQH
jgi:hypothetical protein